jgi:dihydrofolate reductase
VIGGASIYQQAISLANRVYLTVVNQPAPADTFFPDYSDFTTILFQENHHEGGFDFTYYLLERDANH